MECGAVFDVCIKLGLVPRELLGPGKQVLERVVSMLTRLAAHETSPKLPPSAQAQTHAQVDANANANADVNDNDEEKPG